jgi:hypothetical protein
MFYFLSFLNWKESHVFLKLKRVSCNLIIIQSLFLGLQFFRKNSYGVQIVFYFAYMNLQISFAFLMATYFSSVRTATGMCP